MITKFPLYIKNEDWIKVVKSMAMKMVKTMIKNIQRNSAVKVLKSLS